LRDGGIKLEPEFGGSLCAQIVFRSLIDVGGNDLQVRLVPSTFDWVTHQEALAHVPGVRAKAPLGRHDRHLLASGWFVARRGKGRQRQRRAGGKEVASREHVWLR